MLGFLFKKKEKEVVPTYLEQVETATPSEPKPAPFKMKKGEQYITSTPATLCLYKSDGRISGHGITARVKIMKGVYYRVGTGRVGMGKSWQADQSGELHFTTDRIIFDGSNKNLSTQWHKVINLGISTDGKQISIDRESGADWVFVVDQALPISEFKAIDNVFEGK